MRHSKKTTDLATKLWEHPTYEQMDAIQRLRDIEKKLHRAALCQCNGHYGTNELVERHFIQGQMSAGLTYEEAWRVYTDWKNENVAQAEKEETKLRNKAAKIAREHNMHLLFDGDPRGSVMYISLTPIEPFNPHRLGAYPVR